MSPGHSTEEWEELVQAAGSFLAEQAKLGRNPSFTEVNAVLHQRTGIRAFNFESAGYSVN